MARKNRQIETRLTSEYLLANYSQFPYTIGQPLGKVDEALMAQKGYTQAIKQMRPFRPEVDAVVFLPRFLVIVEAKVWNVVNGLSKLPMYKSLVPFTPELKDYLNREVLMELVVGWSNGNLEIMAKDAGVKVVVFCPDWLKTVVDEMHNYWTKDYRDAREQKLQLREFYGLE
jgi:hypothetical protein